MAPHKYYTKMRGYLHTHTHTHTHPHTHTYPHTHTHPHTHTRTHTTSHTLTHTNPSSAGLHPLSQKYRHTHTPAHTYTHVQREIENERERERELHTSSLYLPPYFVDPFSLTQTFSFLNIPDYYQGFMIHRNTIFISRISPSPSPEK